MSDDVVPAQLWAQFRFSVVGPLLASPPPQGQLQESLQELSKKVWIHPRTRQDCRFSKSTIERWYYLVLRERQNPLEKLRRKSRKDLATSKAFSEEVKIRLLKEVDQHGSWSMKLHGDNLAAIIRRDQLGMIPSYSTVRRFLKGIGYQKRSSRNQRKEGYLRAVDRREKWETRSYENPYVGGLWHLDFHKCSREIVTGTGEIVYPQLLGVLDDHSRLLCHVQWYLSESAENLIHGFIQALQKRGLPRSLMSDNGSAMISQEFTRGLKELGIIHETTLPYSPHQNGKQEVLWGQIEGRLLPMLENKKVLTLKELNEATLAWAEMEYNRKPHGEIKSTPLSRYLQHKGVVRVCPEPQRLKEAFRCEEVRKVRQSDGSISLEGKRFEVPFRYRHLESIRIQYARWDLSSVDLVDNNTGRILLPLWPQDKTRNASGERKAMGPVRPAPEAFSLPKDSMAPLLEEILASYSATGLPFAYRPKEEK